MKDNEMISKKDLLEKYGYISSFLLFALFSSFVFPTENFVPGTPEKNQGKYIW